MTRAVQRSGIICGSWRDEGRSSSTLGIGGRSNRLPLGKREVLGCVELGIWGRGNVFLRNHPFVAKKSNVEAEQFRRETAPGIRHGHRGFGPEDDDPALAPHFLLPRHAIVRPNWFSDRGSP